MGHRRSAGVCKQRRSPGEAGPDALRFDFEVGYLVQSPCRDCPRQQELPHCAADCPLLKAVQAMLAAAVATAVPGEETGDVASGYEDDI